MLALNEDEKSFFRSIDADEYLPIVKTFEGHTTNGMHLSDRCGSSMKSTPFLHVDFDRSCGTCFESESYPMISRVEGQLSAFKIIYDKAEAAKDCVLYNGSTIYDIGSTLMRLRRNLIDYPSYHSHRGFSGLN